MKENRFRHLLAADADQINKVPSYDGISPLMSTPDYGSDLSYCNYINNNDPTAKRKKLKKKRKPGIISKDQAMEKIAFTAPTGSYPTFSDIKTPTTQLLGIVTNNFNSLQKFVDSQAKLNDKVAQAINDLEKEIKELKKK
jgi:hypothetical protein